MPVNNHGEQFGHFVKMNLDERFGQSVNVNRDEQVVQ